MSRDLPSLNALRAFEAAARLLSIGKAGEELHVTHGAISRQVRLLEEELGVALLVRDGRGVKLTDAGQRLRDVAGESFQRLQTLCGELRRQPLDAPFVLDCPGSLLARWLIPRLSRIDRDLPELRLQLSSSQGELQPLTSGAHATLLFCEPPWPADVRVYELASESIGPVLSPRYGHYPQLCGAAPDALLGEALLHTGSRPQAWPQWALRNGLAPEELRFGQGFEHLYYLLEAAVAGLGVAIAPRQLVADDLASGRLEAPWGFVETQARLALWVPARQADPRAERLAAWLYRELGER